MTDWMLDDVTHAEAQSGKRAQAARRTRALALPRLALFTAGVLGAFVVSGFLWFADQVSAAKQPLDPHGDGIVVLTGGAQRINGAIALLEEGRATRLLITGVNPATTEDQIARAISVRHDIFDCCVDIDREALDTIENARQTKNWALPRGFDSLIVVTSAYHMPRTLAELRRELPDSTLIPFPVVHEDLELNHWYRDREAMRVMVREYAKFALARLRLSLEASEPTRQLMRMASLRRDL